MRSFGFSQAHIESLARKAPARPDYFMLDSIAKVGPAPEPPVRVEDGEPSNELTDANVQAPLLFWKKALRANSALHRERTLLAKAKAKNGDASASDCSKTGSRNARIHAFRKNRDQLVIWTEEQ